MNKNSFFSIGIMVHFFRIKFQTESNTSILPFFIYDIKFQRMSINKSPRQLANIIVLFLNQLDKLLMVDQKSTTIR